MKSIFYSLLLFLTVNAAAQEPKGNRTLAWQVDMAQNMNYDSAFAYAKSACMESAHLFITWSQLEPDTAQYDATSIANFLDVINIYYPITSTKVELQLAVMNTLAKTTPSELHALPFDDPRMIRRFKTLLDTVFQHIPNVDLAALNIGNEGDIHMGTNATSYNEFKTFIDSISAHAKQLYFNLHGIDLRVGTTFTFHGLTDPATAALCKLVNNSCDIVSTTYYPLNNDFTMKSPAVVESDFGKLVNQYPDTLQPIYFVECGYASSAICNSSEEQQADFYTNVFNAWDTYRANIKYLTIFKTTDWSDAQVAVFLTDSAYGGIQDTTFYEYLRTLGVRTWDGDGNNKKAYNAIRCALKKRNWCSNVSCNTTGITKQDHQQSDVELFPNPARNYVQISSTEPIAKLRVYTAFGKLIKEELLGDRIYFTALPSGTYFLNITTLSGKIVNRPFIVSNE
jgi:hypothetical protein